MEKIIKSLQSMAQCLIKLLNELVTLAEAVQMTDAQWYLNFEDELNKISVKQH